MDNPILMPGDGQNGMSRAHFLRNAALAGLAGGALASFAPGLMGRARGATITVAFFEGETMNPVTGAAVISDSGASAGQAMRIAGGGYAAKNVSFSGNASEVALWVRGVPSSTGRRPQAVVKVNGSTVLNQQVSNTSYGTKSALLTVPAGSHRVRIDNTGGSTTRLIVDSISFSAPDAPPEPANAVANGMALGAHVGNIQHQGLSAMHTHISKTGVVPRVMLVHQSWQWNGSYDPFPAAGINNMYSAWPDTTVVLTWSQAYGTWPNITSIANGQHDAYIRSYATNVKNFGKRIILRPFAEMNGDWYMLFSSQPMNFVAAWKRIVDIFRQISVPNAEFFWCPNATGGGYYGLENYYPGDGYVDWVGLDGYNWAAAHNTAWQYWGEIFTGDLDRLSTLAPSKRQLIGEFGCHDAPGDKGAWFADVHQYLKSGRHPKVAGMVYYDYNADGARWAIDQPPSALDPYKAMAQDAYFRAAL